MRRMRNRWTVVAIVVLGLAGLGSAIALASSKSGKAKSSQAIAFTLRSGVPVAPAEISGDYRDDLASTGAAATQLALLGQQGDHSYYRGSTADGRTCFAIGDSSHLHLLETGCLHSDQAMPTALLDTARVTMSTDDYVLHLTGDEGIAADQVSTVAIERSDGSLVTTPVFDNVYRFADSAIPSDAVAIEALDRSGVVLQRKTLR